MSIYGFELPEALIILTWCLILMCRECWKTEVAEVRMRKINFHSPCASTDVEMWTSGIRALDLPLIPPSKHPTWTRKTVKTEPADKRLLEANITVQLCGKVEGCRKHVVSFFFPSGTNTHMFTFRFPHACGWSNLPGVAEKKELLFLPL